VQVREILVQLAGEQHALEDHGAAGQAHHEPGLRAGHGGRADLVVGALADHVELALEVELVGDLRVAADEHLAHERLAGAGRVAEHAVVRLHRAPADHRLALGLNDLLEFLLDLAPDRGVARQEDDATAVLARLRQCDARLAADLVVEGVRHLNQHARAVAGVHLGTAGAAMIEVLQYLQRLLEDAVRGVALDVDDETNATGIVLEPGVVQALFRGRTLPGGRLRGALAVPARVTLLAHFSRPACIQGAFRRAARPRSLRTGPPAAVCVLGYHFHMT